MIKVGSFWRYKGEDYEVHEVDRIMMKSALTREWIPAVIYCKREDRNIFYVRDAEEFELMFDPVHPQ